MRIDVAPHAPAPWFVEFRFRFDRNLIDDLKALPGCRWDQDRKCWLVPIELYDLMRQGRIVLGEKKNVRREEREDSAASDGEPLS